MADYDLIVIGAGTAARVAAMRVRKAGKHVAIVDSRPYGGTCALRGCDPKKMLRTGAAVVGQATRMRGKGVVGETGIDPQTQRALHVHHHYETNDLGRAIEIAEGACGLAGARQAGALAVISISGEGGAFGLTELDVAVSGRSVFQRRCSRTRRQPKLQSSPLSNKRNFSVSVAVPAFS